MIKIIKITFCVGIVALAVASCRTFFEGEKIRFHSETCSKSRVSAPSPAVHDSVNVQPFGY